MLVALLLTALCWAQTSRDLKLELEAPPQTTGASTRWALVVGVSSYRNVPPHAQLRYAHRDAEEFARFLRSSNGGALSSTQVQLLTEERATVAAIRAALNQWLAQSAGPRDIVYLFFAGHGVIGEENEAYFVAHDSDPQNLSATALSFREVNETLSNRMRAAMVVLLADACHAGGIGWTSSPGTPSNAQPAFEALGGGDRSFLKLLASRPSERSYEDARWGGGHGVFTYSVLRGLSGDAERDRDGVVRASELIDFVSKAVPEQTGARQNPRVAGNFEPRAALAKLSDAAPNQTAASFLNLRGPAGTAVYVDGVFRGSIRLTGDLRVEPLPAGSHRLSVDLPGGQSFDQTVAAGGSLDVLKLEGVSLANLRTMAQRRDAQGAWQYYRTRTFAAEHRALAASVVAAALEEAGQECVNDYVQSTTTALKRAMLVRAAEAYTALRVLRPDDKRVEAKQLFCVARAQIAGNQFAEAEQNLRASLAIDDKFACSYNALGVALARLGRIPEARAAFDRAAKLTPEWSLPYFQVGQQLLAANRTADALPYLKKAAVLNPRSLLAKWTLLRAHRLLDQSAEVEQVGRDILSADPNYAPVYLELGLYFEARRDFARATQAFDSYLVLAPNFADSAQVRERAAKARSQTGRKAPTLRREK